MATGVVVRAVTAANRGREGVQGVGTGHNKTTRVSRRGVGDAGSLGFGHMHRIASVVVHGGTNVE
jgi:hypothetical protein